MSPRARKQKGKGFEDKIAKILHEHFMNNSEGYKSLFDSVDNKELRPKRDFASGNLSGSHGDINLNLLKSFFPYSIECKHWASLDVALNALIQGKMTSLESIWKAQAVPKAKECKLTPCLVFAANRTEKFCFVLADEKIIEKCLSAEINFVKSKKFVIIKFEDFLTIHTS